MEAFPLHTLGPLVEHHALFPNRTNFEVVRMTGDGARRDARLGAWRGRDAVVRVRRVRGDGRGRLLGLLGDTLELRVPGGPCSWSGTAKVT